MKKFIVAAFLLALCSGCAVSVVTINANPQVSGDVVIGNHGE